MKVYLSGYRNHWVSPYTIMGGVLFWKKWTDPKFDPYDDENDYLVKWLDPACELLQKVLNFVHPRIEYVKIDKYDTWSMDSTLAKIILPMLKDIRAAKCGAPSTDDKDVPKHLRSTSAPAKENPWDADALFFDRWNWILDEMIFAFQSIVDDNWEDPFYTGEVDHITEPCEWDADGKPTLHKMVKGPNHTHKFDKNGWLKVEKRIQNGLTLFGKYYRGLWT